MFSNSSAIASPPCVGIPRRQFQLNVFWRVYSFNHADVDDADPDNAGACAESARADASVNEVALPEHHECVDDVRRERGCVRVLELRADVHAHAVRQDAAKDRPP